MHAVVYEDDSVEELKLVTPTIAEEISVTNISH